MDVLQRLRNVVEGDENDGDENDGHDDESPATLGQSDLANSPPHLPEHGQSERPTDLGSGALDDEVAEPIHQPDERLDRPDPRDVPLPPNQSFRPGG